MGLSGARCGDSIDSKYRSAMLRVGDAIKLVEGQITGIVYIFGSWGHYDLFSVLGGNVNKHRKRNEQ